jgi:hypothetical protein
MRTGLDAATGEFLLVAAADDLVLPGLFRCAIAALRAHPEAALFCSQTVLIDPHDRILGFRPITFPRGSAGCMSPTDVRRAIRGTDNWFVGSGVIYRRVHLDAVGRFDGSLGSLADGMANRLLALRYGFCFDPRVLSAWRRYADSMSGQVAMTPGASEKSLAAASRWIATHFPDDVRDEYASLFDRRYRYNLARLRLIWASGRPDARELASLLKLSPFDRQVVTIFSRIPLVNSRLILAWITLRLRPFALSALGASLWRNMTVNRAGRAALQELSVMRALPHHVGRYGTRANNR